MKSRKGITTNTLATRVRRAQLIAEAVSVLCPRCGECQPNKDGSEMWTREDFAKLERDVRDCVSCEGPMQITSDPKAQFV